MRIPMGRAAAVIVAAMLCPAAAAWAQRPHAGMGRPRHPPAARPPAKGGGFKSPKGPGAAIQQFERMSPEEREKALQRLPPERQQKVREQLQRYDQLPPERKQQLQRFWQLPPEDQERVRARMREFNQAPLDRKRAMRRQLRDLGDMTPGERQKYFNSPEFKARFSPEEQETVRTMSEILPPE